jgi:transposase
MTGNNPNDRGKLGTKRHILTDRNGIPISVVMTPANRHDIKAVTDVIDNAVAKQPVAFLSTAKGRGSRRKQHQHLCLDRAYSSNSVKQAIIKRGYVPHILCKRKKGQKKRPYAKRNVLLQKTRYWL